MALVNVFSTVILDVTACPSEVIENSASRCPVSNRGCDAVSVMSPVIALGVSVIGVMFCVMNGPSSGA